MTNPIPHFCQGCGASNQLGDRDCVKCGMRLMLVVFPPAIRHDEGIPPSYYEDHLLERVSLLEIRLAQVAERLSLALDLMLRQRKNTHADHLLLETLIDSLNTLGAVEKDSLTRKWRNRADIADENVEETRIDKFVLEVSAVVGSSKKELFVRMITESLKLIENHSEKQALQMLDQALAISPTNVRLLLFIAETHFKTDRGESARQYLQKIFSIEPEHLQAKLLYGILLADAIMLDEAKQYLLEVLPETDFRNIVNNILGFISAYEKDWKSVLAFFKESLVARDTPENNYLVGCAYFQLKKYKYALRHLQKTVETDTNFADAWFMLAVIYKLTGDETKSFQTLELAWSSKEPGAQCLRFMKRGSIIEVEEALPFHRLKDLQKNLIMGSSLRFTKLTHGEVTRLLND